MFQPGGADRCALGPSDWGPSGAGLWGQSAVFAGTSSFQSPSP